MRWGRRPPSSLDSPKGDKRVIDVLVQHGADLSKARRLRAYVYFPSEESAAAASEQLRQRGFLVETSKAKRRSWLNLVSIEMIVSEESISVMGDDLRQIAAEHGGTYSGWEASPQDL